LVGLGGGLSRAVDELERRPAVRGYGVVDVALRSTNLVGEAVAAGLRVREAGDLRPAERRQGGPNALGIWLRVHLATALGHLAMEAAVEVGVGLRGVVMIAALGVVVAVERVERRGLRPI